MTHCNTYVQSVYSSTSREMECFNKCMYMPMHVSKSSMHAILHMTIPTQAKKMKERTMDKKNTDII